MQSENEYIGDDKFKKFLEHYECPVPLNVVRMRFAGAICSPNLNLRPTDVISSFWDENRQPRLETKKEAELFFKFFMGLWDNVFEDIKHNRLHLPPADKKNLPIWCRNRYEEIEQGYLEGFWGGRDDLKIPAYLAEILDSLSELADVYLTLGKKADSNEKSAELTKTVAHTDKTAERAIGFIIENSVKPRIEELHRTVN